MVDKDTLYQDVYTLVYNAINTNVVDPISVTRGVNKWIYASFPDTRTGTFPGYPIVVVSPANTPSIRTMNFSRSLWNHTIVVTVSVFDTQTERLDSLSSSVVKGLRDNRSTFRAGGLANFAITGGEAQTVLYDNKKIHYRNLIVGFDLAD